MQTISKLTFYAQHTALTKCYRDFCDVCAPYPDTTPLSAFAKKYFAVFGDKVCCDGNVVAVSKPKKVAAYTALEITVHSNVPPIGLFSHILILAYQSVKLAYVSESPGENVFEYSDAYDLFYHDRFAARLSCAALGIKNELVRGADIHVLLTILNRKFHEDFFYQKNESIQALSQRITERLCVLYAQSDCRCDIIRFLEIEPHLFTLLKKRQ